MRADARRNRERLLTAAGVLFTDRGPEVPLDEIARHAGLGPGTLHRHFPSKDALLAAVVIDRVHAHVEYGEALLDGPDPEGGLADLLRRLVVSGVGEAPLKAALSADGFDLRTAAPDAAAALRTTVAALLRRAQTARAVRADLDVDDVMALVAGVFAAVRQADADADPVRVERLLSVLVDGLGT